MTSTLACDDPILSLADNIEKAFLNISAISPEDNHANLRADVLKVFHALEAGQCRIAEPCSETTTGWKVNDWLKKAILLYFRLFDNRIMQQGEQTWFDKVPLQFTQTSHEALKARKIRIVPPATIRAGSYIGPNTVVMPSYINLGAFVDEGTMIDTWATVGSCAQIGKNVHLSGGVGIGGVLEPLQATPTIIEDNCFIGARSEIVEGVIVGANSVISMGVYIGQSTKILNRQTGEIHYGRVPNGSVVVPGSMPDASGLCHLNCAVIVKTVDDKTRQKTSINELLRCD